MDPDRRRQVALELLRQHESIVGAAMADRHAEAIDPRYWTSLCPGMSIGDAQPAQSEFVVPEDELRRFASEGYGRVAGAIDRAAIEPLARSVAGVVESGWPPIFAMVFDQFWQLAWGSPVRAVAEAVLGAGCGLRPNIAVHVVDAGSRPSGWHPHRDGPGRTGRITTWVALTDATTENGCIFVVPSKAETADALSGFDARRPQFEQVQSLLHNVRALPAPAGSVMFWHFDLLHWGSVAVSAEAPRVSVAFEWVAADVPLQPDEGPLFDVTGPLPSFEERLAMIARAILAYPDFDQELAPLAALAERLR